MSNPFGFAVRSKDDAPVFLPLKGVTVNASIIDVSAQVELTQVYANTEAIENTAARYIFPVPANAAVCSFKMETADGRTVRAVVKETSAAKREFENAVSEGKWAGLLEKVTGDVFVVSIGAIPSGQDIRVYITYVEELSQDDLVNQVRFSLPTYIADRYGSTPEAMSHHSSAAPAATKLDIRVNIQMATPIQKVASPSHTIVHTAPSLVPTGHASVYTSTVTLDTSSPQTFTNEDFILTIQADDLNKPRCVAAVDHARNSVAVSLTLVPQFGVPPIDSQEYVFVIDRSGSMGGQRMAYAKDALQVLLKSLPTQGTSFNIASFGSSFSSLWSRSQEYNQATLKIATDHVESLSANMGGTEIGGVLQSVFHDRAENMPTAVFVLTDGKVWNTSPIFTAVRTAVSKSGDASLGTYLRVFTLGIGDGASTELCRGLARTGNGLCYMVSNNEDVPSRCSALLKAARVPPIGSLWGLSIDWGHPTARVDESPAISRDHINVDAETFSFFDETLDPEEEEKYENETTPKFSGRSDSSLVKQAPAAVPDIYPYNRFIVSAILLNTTQIPSAVVLKGKMPGGEDVKMTLQVQLAESAMLLHTLAARRIIADLQDGNLSSLTISDNAGRVTTQELIKVEVVRLSEEYQLASQYAAFVAVEEQPEELQTASEESKQRDVPGETSEVYDMPFFRDTQPIDDDGNSIDTFLENDVIGDFGMHGVNFGKRAVERATPVHIKLIQAAKNVCFSNPREHLQNNARGTLGMGFFAKNHLPMESSEALVGEAFPQFSGPKRRTMGISSSTENSTEYSFACRFNPEPAQFDKTFTSERNGRTFQSASYGRAHSWKSGQDRYQPPGESSQAHGEELYAMTSNVISVVKTTGSNNNDGHDAPSTRRHSSSLGHRLQQEAEPTSSFVDSDPADWLMFQGSQMENFIPTPFPPAYPELQGHALPEAPYMVETWEAVSSNLNPTSADIAKLQSYYGSFSLSEQLVEILAATNPSLKRYTLADLKMAIPGGITSVPGVEEVWATLLAAAMMRKRMADSKDVWVGMWDKAKAYVLEKIGGDEATFVRWLGEAEDYV